MSEPWNTPRIGDAERDAAAERLRDNMASGRLQYEEFDERLGKALQARTQPELDALFTDLPQAAPPAAPLVAFQEPGTSARMERRQQRAADPWWTHWGLFVAAIMLSGATNGRLGILIPLMAVWVWWLGPTIARDLRQRRDLGDGRDRRELDR